MCDVAGTNSTIKEVTNSAENEGQTQINLTANEENLLVSAFNFGLVLTHLAGPWLAIRIGFKRVLLFSTLATGILVH